MTGRFLGRAPTKPRPVRTTEYDPVPLERGDVAYFGYRPDYEANMYLVRPADGMAPYPLGRLLAAAPELYACVQAYAAQPTGPDSLCHKGLTTEAACVRCGPILEARALLTRIDGEGDGS